MAFYLLEYIGIYYDDSINTGGCQYAGGLYPEEKIADFCCAVLALRKNTGAFFSFSVFQGCCYRVAKVLREHGINTLNDFNAYENRKALDADILKVKGQSSGIMRKYLYMLAGKADVVKPDRHMVNFMKPIFPHLTISEKHHAEIQEIIEKTAAALKPK